MASTLKMVFALTDQANITLSLAEPKEDLTKTQVQTVTNKIITDQMLLKDGAHPTRLKEAYIEVRERVELED